MREFFGKYRGKVVGNVDPLYRGRLQVVVPAVLGEGRVSWAMPCVPYAGKNVGFYVLPPVSANVWVEFEGGDPDFPIWSGCFWSQGELPLPPPAPATTKMLKTDTISLTLDDAPGAGGLTIEVKPPAVQVPLKVVMNSEGIAVTCNPAALKLTPTGVEITFNNASIKFFPEALELAVPPAGIKLSPSGLNLEHVNATVKLAAAVVTINNGALEVI